MVRIEFSKNYLREEEKFVKRNKKVVNFVIKALNLFKSNPNHPSLHIEKLKGTKVWSMRVDKGNRIFFTWKNKNTTLFLDIGKHDKYRRY